MSAGREHDDSGSCECASGMLGALPRTVGFFFAFRLILVLLAVRVFQAEPQTGVAVSIGMNLLLLAVVAFHSFRTCAHDPLLRVASAARSGGCLLFLGLFLLQSALDGSGVESLPPPHTGARWLPMWRSSYCSFVPDPRAQSPPL